MNTKQKVQSAINHGDGILKLAPNWVPRYFCTPGKRLKLHPDDYYAMGIERGGIDERWLASTTPADNGPLTSENEGLSLVVFPDGPQTHAVTLRDAMSELKDGLIGERLWKKYAAWPMYSKFFDNEGALGFHIHHDDSRAARVGMRGKPEAYFFPPQLNNHYGSFPYTFFGLQPGTTKDQVLECLKNFGKNDNRITTLSTAYRLEPGTGWDVPPGVLHAPGSLCTYEPQVASDVYAFYESLVHDRIMPEELLWKTQPPEEIGNFDALLDAIDWDINLDPNFGTNRFMKRKSARPVEQSEEDGFSENWICYKSEHFSAKELTIQPQKTVVIKDSAAYGMILMQGHGKMGPWEIECPALIRYGQLSADEFFVSETAAAQGVKITNNSISEPMVMLKHFGPGNPDYVCCACILA